MNYKPVVVGNQSNGIAGVETDSPSDGFKPLEEEEKKDDKDPGNEDNEVLSIEELRVNQEKDANVNSTNNINAVSPTANAASTKNNVVDKNIVYGCADDPNMLNLEEIGKVNPTHAYYNGSSISKDKDDLGNKYEDQRTHKSTSALEAPWMSLFFFVFVLVRNI
nr:hypothetical protein [Tanacetum cinerariifolium]